MTAKPWSALVAIGAGLAAAGTVHSTINCVLLRTPRASGQRASDQRTSGQRAAQQRAGAARLRASILVPARNESAGIADCLRALGAQQQRAVEISEILVMDDDSEDGTAEVIAELARDWAGPPLTLLRAAPLAIGWLGKSAACAQLAAAADPTCGILVFVDADVRLEPQAVDAACALLSALKLDLISPYPRQIAISVQERLIQPLLQWSWLTFLPLRAAERSARGSLSAANGQFLLVRRDSYLRAGGHGAVRDEVLEDIALLRAIKAIGGHGIVVDGTDLATCRMYDSPALLRDGYRKSLWSAFGSPVRAAAVLLMLIVAYVIPPLAALRGSRTAAAGYAAAVAGRVICARRTGGRAWPDALAHPLSIGGLAVLTAQSLSRRRRAQLHWRGRMLPGRPE